MGGAGSTTNYTMVFGSCESVKWGKGLFLKVLGPICLQMPLNMIKTAAGLQEIDQLMDRQ